VLPRGVRRGAPLWYGPSEGSVEGQQHLEVLDGFRFRQLSEQATQVRRFEFVGPCGLHQAVMMGTRLAPLTVSAKSQLRLPKAKGRIAFSA
jgi:hypothetical protein